MFDSMLELISQAASNSLFIFFFCNLIIVMILIGSKSGPNFDQESQIPISIVTYRETSVKQGQETVARHSFHGTNMFEVSQVTEPPTKAEHSLDLDGNKMLAELPTKAEHSLNFDGNKMLTEVCRESKAPESPSDDRDQENGEEDDELRRRVEEFIQKVNREWREELLRTSRFI
ncbi:hypothetical protein Tsubulata_024662 [Turnera subulata]|uniref:DUF4408 domain-containing protein n=1 Tax=Turnera subulata TaxID=218843 RepID=A0A9Q0G5Y6_9ROSI|nr:hypothetical protein Tsubulata_024662 [Turnera subulata]